MTNFEWIKNDDGVLKDTMIYSLAVYKDTRRIAKCKDIACWECLFCGDDGKRCADLRREWLEQEYQPLYKRGDIITDGDGKMYLVISESCNMLMVTNNFNDFIGNKDLGISYIKVTDVVGKISSYIHCDID